MKRIALLTVALFTIGTTFAHAHCQVPCGIYGDAARFETMLEHTVTITKAMSEINRLDARAAKSTNQSVRWVNTKETHAQAIQDIIGDYFLAQRIKETQEDYTERLVLSHKVIVSAMKAKQTTDLANAKALKKAIQAFKTLYFPKPSLFLNS
jgi:nickel superoxide dismutase